MKKHYIFPFLSAAILSLSLLLSGCGARQTAPSAEDDSVLTIAATTYPVYELLAALTGGMDHVVLTLVVDQQISCLHDYTLTVEDMRTLEHADVIVINGAGLEAFMADALSTVDVPVIDCSESISLLPATGHGNHDHSAAENEDDHYDPHLWLDPERYMQMMDNAAQGLSALGYGNYDDYRAIMRMSCSRIDERFLTWKKHFDALPQEKKLLITFHDGFSYLADAYGLTILRAIEEEAGSEASAKDIKEIVELIREYDIPMIFVEENGSDATAKAIQRETGVAIGTLSMLMSPDDSTDYIQRDDNNLKVIYEGLSGEELPEHEE